MARDSWHFERDGDRLTLSRGRRVRFDVSAETRLGHVARGKLAMQVRQDIWRALQGLRGFSPVVEVVRDAEGLFLRAGGEVAAPVFPKAWAEARLTEVLSCPDRRRRWQAFAAVSRGAA